jgi:hypothetical protein
MHVLSLPLLPTCLPASCLFSLCLHVLLGVCVYCSCLSCLPASHLSSLCFPLLLGVCMYRSCPSYLSAVCPHSGFLCLFCFFCLLAISQPYIHLRPCSSCLYLCCFCWVCLCMACISFFCFWYLLFFFTFLSLLFLSNGIYIVHSSNLRSLFPLLGTKSTRSSPASSAICSKLPAGT